MKPLICLTLAVASPLAIGLLADTIPDPDPKISLSGGGGSTPIELGVYTFNLDGSGGGIFPFCNNTPYAGSTNVSCSHQELEAAYEETWQPGSGFTFQSFEITTAIPEGKTIFTCQSELFAYCVILMNAENSISVDFFGVGYYYSSGTGFAEFPGLINVLGYSPTLNYFPGVPPGAHFIANFNNDPSCVPAPDQPCQGSRDPGAPVVVQANTPEPAAWLLLLTAGLLIAAHKRWLQSGRVSGGR